MPIRQRCTQGQGYLLRSDAVRPRALTRPARAVATGAALLALVLTATSCNAGRPPAATVAGRDLSAQRLDDLVGAFLEADPDTYGAQIEGQGEDTYQMAAVSSVLTTLVIQMAQAELAEQEGAIPTEEERTEAEDLVRNSFAAGASAEVDPTTGQPSEEALQAQEASAAVFDALSEDTREWLIDLRASTLALGRVAAEDSGDLEEQARQIYDADPSAFERLCVRAVLVETADVPDVQARLDAGEDLGAVSSEVTVVPELAAAGGELGQCLPPDQLAAANLPPQIVEVLRGLEVGDVSEPFDLGDGTTAWFDLSDRQQPPFEEVQPQIEASLPDPGEAALSQLVQESIGDIDIHVDPRFGTWDPETGIVSPPAGARTPETEPTQVEPVDAGAVAPEVEDVPTETATSGG